MTYGEMKTRFLVGYDAITNFTAPGYTDAEISGFLNQAQDLLVDELYLQGEVAILAEILVKQNYNVVACTIEDYGAKAYQLVLTIQSSITGPVSSMTLSDLSYRWTVNAKAKLTRTDPFVVATEWVECNEIRKWEADKYYQTSFNRPIIVFPKIFRQDDTFIILIDYYTTISTTAGFQLIFIKTPDRIDVATTAGLPELTVKLHQKIVDKAVALAMKATEPQRADAEIKLNQAL
jgi:hypothetical protein